MHHRLTAKTIVASSMAISRWQIVESNHLLDSGNLQLGLSTTNRDSNMGDSSNKKNDERGSVDFMRPHDHRLRLFTMQIPEVSQFQGLFLGCGYRYFWIKQLWSQNMITQTNIEEVNKLHQRRQSTHPRCE
jgi:hypothetical protein